MSAQCRVHRVTSVCSVVSDSATTDCRPPGSSVHGTVQARILEQVAISHSKGSSQPRDQTGVSCIGRRILYPWATWEATVLPSHPQNVWLGVSPPPRLFFFLVASLRTASNTVNAEIFRPGQTASQS